MVVLLTTEVLGAPLHDDVNGGALLGVSVGVLTAHLVALLVTGRLAVHVLTHGVVHLRINL